MAALGRHFQVITYRLSSRVFAASRQASSGQVPISGHEIPAVRFNGRPSDSVCFVGLRKGQSSTLLADLTCSYTNFGPSVSLKASNFYEEERLGGRPGLQSLLHSSRSENTFARTVFSRGYITSYTNCRGPRLATSKEQFEICSSYTPMTMARSPMGVHRGFAKAVPLPPQMQKPMRIRVYMGSPGVIGEPFKPRPPPLPFLRRWFTKEGWQIKRQNVLAMLKTGFTLAKLRQRTKGYSQAKFYREATDLYKEINTALAQGDRNALRQLVTDKVLTTMKKELKHREAAWARVHWEIIGPIKRISTLQGRLFFIGFYPYGTENSNWDVPHILVKKFDNLGVDQKNMDTAFAQLTLRIVSKQKFAAYDHKGKLAAGDPEKELTVEEIWVFERQVSQPEARWRLCGRLSV